MAQPLTDQQILQQFGETVISDIRKNAASQDRNATGRASAGLTEVATDSQLLVKDTAGYTQWGWEYGRRPGKFPPIAPLVEWVLARNIATGAKAKSVAFLVARKIANSGTNLWIQNQGNPSGVISDAISYDRIEALKSAFATKYHTQVQSEIVEAFKAA